MLTNVYYYNYYKPYILSDYKREKIGNSSRVYTFLANNDETYVLNKALKKDVINYASQLSRAVNGLKDSSKSIVRDLGNFAENERREGYDTAVKWLEDDLSDFVEAYNGAREFARKHNDSHYLNDFTNGLGYDLSISTKALNGYHINVSNEGELSFDAEAYRALSKKSVRQANKQNIPFFKHVYDSTGEFLQAPLSEHMNFKSLKYYYNYQSGSIHKDSFELIDRGMIIDEVV